jgi:hypothetical protein
MNVTSPSIAVVPVGHHWRAWWPSATERATIIAALAAAGIVAHLALRWGSNASTVARDLPLYVALAAGGVPLVLSLALRLVRRQFGSDLLAGISIVAAVLLEEYLAGAFVVLMLSGGEAVPARKSIWRPRGIFLAALLNVRARRPTGSSGWPIADVSHTSSWIVVKAAADVSV